MHWRGRGPGSPAGDDQRRCAVGGSASRARRRCGPVGPGNVRPRCVGCAVNASRRWAGFCGVGKCSDNSTSNSNSNSNSTSTSTSNFHGTDTSTRTRTRAFAGRRLYAFARSYRRRGQR
jgi:hypothetical protein